MKYKSYMKEVANILGVEMNEEFKISNSLDFVTYSITEDGLFDCFGNKCREQLGMILDGGRKIIKKPWEPTKYSYPCISCGRECNPLERNPCSDYYRWFRNVDRVE